MILLASNGLIILVSIAVFLIVIILLVAMLIFARKKLTPQGDVTLTVNDKDFTVSPGTTVLNTLSGNGIFLPSAFQLKRGSLLERNNKTTGDLVAR
jgi:Na+-transporting NADH:ubiquinone oxidoreductase subunit F